MTYPALDPKLLMDLLPIREHLSIDPEFLDKPDCPYGADIRATLKTLFPPLVEVKATASSGRKAGKGKNEISEEQAAVIEAEATALLQELKDLKPPSGKGFDHDTKISIIKAKTALIEKVVTIQERFFNIRKVSTFMKTVINILDKMVDPDKRNDFLKELEPYL